jgi:hypothetical protein
MNLPNEAFFKSFGSLGAGVEVLVIYETICKAGGNLRS